VKSKDQAALSVEHAAARRERLAEAMHLQAMEGNPLDADDIALFEMFEREGWSDERRLEYIIAQATGRRVPNAAE
jgi:hypothetical protein